MIAQDESFPPRSRQLAVLLIATIAVLTLIDIWEDASEGATWAHMAGECVVVLCSVVAASLLWRSSLRHAFRRTKNLEDDLRNARNDLEHWRSQTLALSRDLHTAISEQLDIWSLSPAEKEVALLLLQGLSLKEIANARETSERTVRQHAAAIYQKSNLEGRAQLSAFFLEDLLGRPRPN